MGYSFIRNVMLHRSFKLPSQIRWNILFNILLWSLLIQPICLPLVCHYVPLEKSLDSLYLPADWFLYWLHAIQACMTLAWLITAFLALNTFRKVLMADKSFSGDSVVEDKYTHVVCLAVYKEPIDVIIETIDSIARCVRRPLMQSTIGFYPFISNYYTLHVRIFSST